MSPVHEALVEESVLDGKNTNSSDARFPRQLRGHLLDRKFRPMGVHTGDSITVAPAQTLTDKEYSGCATLRGHRA